MPAPSLHSRTKRSSLSTVTSTPGTRRSVRLSICCNNPARFTAVLHHLLQVTISQIHYKVNEAISSGGTVLCNCAQVREMNLSFN